MHDTYNIIELLKLRPIQYIYVLECAHLVAFGSCTHVLVLAASLSTASFV